LVWRSAPTTSSLPVNTAVKAWLSAAGQSECKAHAPTAGSDPSYPAARRNQLLKPMTCCNLTHDQRITALSSALQGSHDEIRRLTTHLQEVARRRKYLELLRASPISKLGRITGELSMMQSSLGRISEIVKDSTSDSNSPFA